MRRSRNIALLLTLLALTPLGVAAQSAQRFSLQFSALVSAPFGETLDNVSVGAGWEAQLRINPGLLSIGAGAEQTFHTWQGQPLDVTLLGGFIEPRLVIPLSSDKAAPYLSARVDLSQIEFSDASGGSATATGFTVNGGGGILIVLSSRVNLDVGATIGYKDLGNATIGTTLWDLGTGANVIGRVGLAIGLGG